MGTRIELCLLCRLNSKINLKRDDGAYRPDQEAFCQLESTVDGVSKLNGIERFARSVIEKNAGFKQCPRKERLVRSMRKSV